MKIKLHHVNLCSTNVGAMDEFYRGVLDMEPEPALQASRIGDGYPGKVAFLSGPDRARELLSGRGGGVLVHDNGSLEEVGR